MKALAVAAILAFFLYGCGGTPLRDIEVDAVTTRAAIDKTPAQINTAISGGQQVVDGTTHSENNQGTLSTVFEEYCNQGDGGSAASLAWRAIAVNGAQEQGASEMILNVNPEAPCEVSSIAFGRESVKQIYDPSGLAATLNERDAKTQETIQLLLDKIEQIPPKRQPPEESLEP